MWTPGSYSALTAYENRGPRRGLSITRATRVTREHPGRITMVQWIGKEKTGIFNHLFLIVSQQWGNWMSCGSGKGRTLGKGKANESNQPREHSGRQSERRGEPTV